MGLIKNIKKGLNRYKNYKMERKGNTHTIQKYINGNISTDIGKSLIASKFAKEVSSLVSFLAT